MAKVQEVGHAMSLKAVVVVVRCFMELVVMKLHWFQETTTNRQDPVQAVALNHLEEVQVVDSPSGDNNSPSEVANKPSIAVAKTSDPQADNHSEVQAAADSHSEVQAEADSLSEDNNNLSEVQADSHSADSNSHTAVHRQVELNLLKDSLK